MESEIGVKYSTLLVHHLEKEEVEFELEVRAVPFEKNESLAVLRRRLREKLKKEKGDHKDVDFENCEGRTVDGEIDLIDKNVKEISDFLERKKTFEGVREALRTRLVHYFARCSAIQAIVEKDEDFEDIDKLLGTIRQLYSNYFTIFTPIDSIRKEVMLQISNSLTQLQLGQAGSSKVPSVSRETQTDDTEVGDHELDKQRSRSSAGSLARRQLRSTLQDQHSSGGHSNSIPLSGLLSKQRGSYQPERVLRRIRLSGTHVDSEPVSDSSLSASPPRRSKSRPQRSNARRSRPVSEWKLRYDGRDGGRELMKFIREVEFFAKSENVSDEELFRSERPDGRYRSRRS
ncbi:uncharacterized protein LOC134288994 [Aedes albopictus]|uniref:Uncharacterized protein n=1 Tax=Aedes albopictus TaxID=7160 RepID=A0ABM1ZH53_AEDAL